jgi:hypothetical protein
VCQTGNRRVINGGTDQGGMSAEVAPTKGNRWNCQNHRADKCGGENPTRYVCVSHVHRLLMNGVCRNGEVSVAFLLAAPQHPF